MNNITIGKVNDVKGFFKTYKELRADNFNALFGTVSESDILTLDYCLSDLYGSRCLQSRFTDIYNNQSASECMVRIVIIADKLYFDNWLNTKHTIEKALLTDLDKPLTSEKTGNNNTENQINAFDSGTASDSDNSIHNYTETARYSNGKTATQNAKTQIDFTKNNDFLEIIINDILSMCCISIYDDSYTSCHSSSGGGSDPELENRVAQCESDISDIKKIIPGNATEQNKLATIADIQSGGGSDPELENRVTQCENNVSDIKKLIPETATEQNKLATIADIQSGYDDTELRGKVEENTQNIQAIYDDLTGYATKQELQAVENQIPDVTNLATKSEIQAINNLIPSNASIENKLATVSDVTNLATKSELQAVENQIPDVTNLATKSELQAVENQIPDVTNLATKNELQAVENQIPDVTNLATKSEIQAINNLIPSNASSENKLATMADVGGGGGSGGSYYTVGQEVDTGNIYKEGSREKPIYRKVLNVASISSGGTVDISTSFTGATRFISITGSYNLNNIRHCLGYYHDGASFKGVQAEVRMSMVRFSVLGAGLTFTDVSLIIEYIK